MSRVMKTITVDHKIFEKFKETGLNASSVCEKAMAAAINGGVGISDYQEKIKALIKGIKEERKTIKDLRSLIRGNNNFLEKHKDEKWFREAIKIIKRNPKFAEGRADSIKINQDITISPEELRKIAREID